MQLFGTMKIDNGHIPRLTYHTNRIKCSSERLNFKFDEYTWRNELNDVTTKYHSGQYRLRIVLNAESKFETIVSPLPEGSSFTTKFQVLPKVVNSTFIKNKTTGRKHLTHNHGTDLVLLTSGDDKVPEFDIGNIVTEEDGKWYTPNYKDDLLRGCMRDYSMDSNRLVEKDFDKNELIYKYHNNEIRLFLINSLREIADVHLRL